MRKLTLTFDNGPYPGVTERVLSLLEERAIRTTFFLVGQQLAAPGAMQLAERAKKAGHRIGNHTWSHGTPLGRRADLDHPQAEIGATEALIGKLAEPVRLFRPNGGGQYGAHLLSRAAADHLAAKGYTVVTWNSVPGDYAGDPSWVSQALSDIARNDWTLMVLHDIPSAPLELLESFLDRIEGMVEIVQDYPDACLPMVGGVPRENFREIVTQS